nr:MAG TPA: hypothetical protein [Siphoviridae sp. ctngg6]
MDISKIELPDGSKFDIKDAYLTHVINVLLGIEEPDERDIR